MKKLKINYPALKAMIAAFTSSTNIIGNIIRAVTKGKCSHALVVTDDHGQLFATEETFGGLKENSLEEYIKPSNRVVYAYYWKGWDDSQKRELAQQFLAEIRRRRGEQSMYDFPGLFVFIKEKLPKWLQWLIPVKPDPKREWCSENVLTVHDRFGFNSGWAKERGPSPAELNDLFSKRNDCIPIFDFYIPY